MALVKVKIYDTIVKTEKATCFLFKFQKRIWLPNFWFKWARQGNYILLEEDFAKEKDLEYVNYVYVPNVIKPLLNQKPIDDLIYEEN